MGRTIAIANQKGGVGKTTTAVNVAVALGDLGQRVLVVDLDPQANATSGLGVDYRILDLGSYEAIIGDAHPVDAIQPAVREGVDLLPATPNLAGANVELVELDRREFRLADALALIRDDYDYVIIDCPPSLGLLTVNALAAADEVLIPVQTEFYALQGIDQLLDTINLVRERLQERLTILGAVMTMFDDENRLARTIFNDVYRTFPHRVFRVVIPRHPALAEAPSLGLSIFEHSRTSHGARAYRRLAKEIHRTGGRP